MIFKISFYWFTLFYYRLIYSHFSLRQCGSTKRKYNASLKFTRNFSDLSNELRILHSQLWEISPLVFAQSFQHLPSEKVCSPLFRVVEISPSKFHIWMYMFIHLTLKNIKVSSFHSVPLILITKFLSAKIIYKLIPKVVLTINDERWKFEWTKNENKLKFPEKKNPLASSNEI